VQATRKSLSAREDLPAPLSLSCYWCKAENAGVLGRSPKTHRSTLKPDEPKKGGVALGTAPLMTQGSRVQQHPSYIGDSRWAHVMGKCEFLYDCCTREAVLGIIGRGRGSVCGHIAAASYVYMCIFIPPLSVPSFTAPGSPLSIPRIGLSHSRATPVRPGRAPARGQSAPAPLRPWHWLY